MNEIKAEIRKLITVRSTYFISLAVVLLVGLIGFYAQGYRLSPSQYHDRFLLNNAVIDSVTALILFVGVVAVLALTHEYRYNTIVYTLTSANRRYKVLLGKVIAVSLFAVALTSLIAVLSPLASSIGVKLAGGHLVPQTIYYSDLIWRVLFYGWAYAMLALLLATLIRNQVAAIVSLFAVPILEQIFVNVLKDNVVYLPFNSLSAVLNDPQRGSITHQHAAFVISSYLIIGWIIAIILFNRRDAN